MARYDAFIYLGNWKLVVGMTSFPSRFIHSFIQNSQLVICEEAILGFEVGTGNVPQTFWVRNPTSGGFPVNPNMVAYSKTINWLEILTFSHFIDRVWLTTCQKGHIWHYFTGQCCWLCVILYTECDWFKEPQTSVFPLYLARLEQSQETVQHIA